MTDRYLQLLRQYWGHADFRGIQRDIIESIGSGHDTLGLMPTGGGKSVTFQVPAMAQEGVCIVITPLIALMKDQVQNLRRRGIMAAAIYSGMSRHEILVALDNCILGDTKLLYVSPERIASDLFRNKLRRINVSFITVDEAHCISQWGYDFRPSYLHIADIRRLKPGVPVLALTATATPEVVDDIQERLGFKEKRVYSMSFERKNLAYVVRDVRDKHMQMLNILRAVDGSSIVYVRSRSRAKAVSDWLNEQGVSATFYHAGLEPSVKDERQKAWHDDKLRVMVATNAFVMGIDKPDVRTVIHIDCPSSIEAYFQEAGRAGRDGGKAYAVLLFNHSDQLKLDKRVDDEFPDKEFVRDVYEHLAYFYQVGYESGCGHTFAFDIQKFCITYGYFPIRVNSALKILSRAGYLDYDMEPDAASRLRFTLDRDELYRYNNPSPVEEAVVSALLRKYSGLFTDYSYIDETLLAHDAGVTRQTVYLTLRNLTQRHIVHYIPQRKMPTITYLRDRIDGKDVALPREVYEERREQFAKRIKRIVAYAVNDNVCRSRQLLRYFGETKSCDCGICDVCTDHESSRTSMQATEKERAAILHLLSDGMRHDVTELNASGMPYMQMRCALEYLIDEEIIEYEEPLMWWPEMTRRMLDERRADPNNTIIHDNNRKD